MSSMSSQDHGDGRAFIGKQIRKKVDNRMSSGEVSDFDPATKLYKIRYANDSVENLAWSDLQLLLPYELKRIPRKKKENVHNAAAADCETHIGTSKEVQGTASSQKSMLGTESIHQTLEAEEAVSPSGGRPSMMVSEETAELRKQTVLETEETQEQERDTEHTQQDDDVAGEGCEGLDDEDAEGAKITSGDETDSSLEPELLSPKKRKKRKYVLTLQKYKGKKRKLKVEVDAAAANADGAEEAMPRQEPRVKMLSDVHTPRSGYHHYKLSAEDARELKSILKQSLPPATEKPELDDSEHGYAHQGKSKDITSILQATTPSVDKPKDITSFLDSKPSPYDRGIKLRGRKLRKKVKGKVYRGEVADYDRRTRYYKVRYDDGDEERLLWKDVQPLLATLEEMSRWESIVDDEGEETKQGGDEKKRSSTRRSAGRRQSS